MIDAAILRQARRTGSVKIRQNRNKIRTAGPVDSNAAAVDPLQDPHRYGNLAR
jgi:hypothetical protein